MLKVTNISTVGNFQIMWQIWEYVDPTNGTWSRGSSVSIVSDYGLDDRAIEVRSPADAKGFFL
jgi:hypothetical protein